MAPESSTLKKGARVVVITDLPGVSAGTAGRVGRSIGIKPVRYRVQFENGVNSLSDAESRFPVLAPINILIPQTPSNFSQAGNSLEFSYVPPK